MFEPSGGAVAAPEMRDSDSAESAPEVTAVRDTEVKGQGVFLTRPHLKGEVVIVGKPLSTSQERSWRSVQTDVDTHIRIDLPFEFVNHSCDPNCGVQPNEHQGYNLVAMRDIEAGEELTFDYCMTEWTIVGFEDCHCGSDRCRKRVRGAKFLPLAKLREYKGFVAPYLEPLLRDFDGAAA